MYCRECGSELPDGVRFCKVCGAEQEPMETRTYVSAPQDGNGSLPGGGASQPGYGAPQPGYTEPQYGYGVAQSAAPPVSAAPQQPPQGRPHGKRRVAILVVAVILAIAIGITIGVLVSRYLASRGPSFDVVFSDVELRQALLVHDKNGDNHLSKEEAEEITNLTIGENVHVVDGLEYLPKLEHIDTGNRTGEWWREKDLEESKDSSKEDSEDLPDLIIVVPEPTRETGSGDEIEEGHKEEDIEDLLDDIEFDVVPEPIVSDPKKMLEKSEREEPPKDKKDDTSKDEQPDPAAERYAAYRGKVEELQSIYGEGYVEEASAIQAKGLFLVELIDFDGDGDEELLLGYHDQSRDKNDGSFADADAYWIEVWSFENGEMVQNYSQASDHSNGGFAYQKLYRDGDSTYLYIYAYGTSDDGRDKEGGLLYALQDGQMVVIHEFECIGVYDDQEAIYRIDGEEYGSFDEYWDREQEILGDYQLTEYQFMESAHNGSYGNDPGEKRGASEILETTDETIEKLRSYEPAE